MKGRYYKVLVTETYEKEFNIYAISEEAAKAEAEEKANNDAIMYNDEYYTSRDICVIE